MKLHHQDTMKLKGGFKTKSPWRMHLSLYGTFHIWFCWAHSSTAFSNTELFNRLIHPVWSEGNTICKYLWCARLQTVTLVSLKNWKSTREQHKYTWPYCLTSIKIGTTGRFQNLSMWHLKMDSASLVQVPQVLTKRQSQPQILLPHKLAQHLRSCSNHTINLCLHFPSSNSASFIF